MDNENSGSRKEMEIIIQSHSKRNFWAKMKLIFFTNQGTIFTARTLNGKYSLQ